MQPDFRNRDIVSITDFSRDEILHLCSVGKMMHTLEKTGKRDTLRSALSTRTLSSMFYEPSTRTRTSFHTAMRELGGQCDGFSGSEGTSVMKKESIRDTVMMMCANHFDAIVMRHPFDGSLQWAADVSNIPVINGGDGKNEHPTQALLDTLTLYMLNGERLDGLNVGFGGDLSHGRTVRSLSLALSHFENITLRWAAEDFLGMPEDLTALVEQRGVKVIRDDSVSDVLRNVQFYYMTRPQLERMGTENRGHVEEVMRKYRIDLEKIGGFEAKILHPLPVNSEIAEIDYRAYFAPVQVFYKQAEFGVFLRKALIYEMLKHEGYIQYSGVLHPELEHGNNRLPRAIRESKAGGMFIDKIQNGTVLDHLQEGSLKDVDKALDLETRGYSSITAVIATKKNPFLKTNMPELSERHLKSVASVSPEPTVNYIKAGRVSEKFVYLLCRNANCIARNVYEDVPPKFYNGGGRIRCRYCRRPYAIVNRKVTEEERRLFIEKLPTEIEAIDYREQSEHQHLAT